MLKDNLEIQNFSPINQDTIPVSRAVSVPSPGASCFPAILSEISVWKKRLFVLPPAIAPLFYARRLDAWKIKNAHDKMFTALMIARRELLADPNSDSRRAI